MMSDKELAMTRLKNLRLGILGAGNMGQTFIRCLVGSETMRPSQIVVSNRTQGKLQKLANTFGVKPVPTNEQLVEASDVIIVAVKPQDLFDAIEPLANYLSPEKIVMSLAAGISLDSLRKILPEATPVVRVMPNTPATIQRGVVGYCIGKGFEKMIEPLVQDLLRPLGYVVAAQEGEQFEALTVAAGSGPGFIFELMQYWQEWLEEHNFDPDEANQIVIETFLGSAMLAAHDRKVSITELQDRVVSKKGVTFAGLESMRELEIERALRYSFEKAVLRSHELGQIIRIKRGTQRN